MQTIRQYISLHIIHPCLRIINRCTPKSGKNIFFLPHHNCKHDNYDVINYGADNTLCLINYMLREKRYNGYTFYIVHYEKEREQEYISYCRQINPAVNCIFLYAAVTQRPVFKHLIAFYHCQYAFASDVYYNFTSKLRSQTVTSLGYFTPFKSDERHLTDKRFDQLREYYNRSYSYQITTSKISSHIQCVDKGLYWNRHLALGFPRNDIFYAPIPDNSIAGQLAAYLQIPVKKIILYTPTYRDYDTSESEKRSVFGFAMDKQSMASLSAVMDKEKAILIYKLHPWQEQSCIIDSDSKRLLNYRNIPFTCNLYTIMAETDVLITDYTSTYFDFLHRDKPVIFNFYDLERYESLRGLSYQPVECITAGHIVTNATEMITAVQELLSGKDPYREKRSEIHRLFNYHHDGNSAKRICQQILAK